MPTRKIEELPVAATCVSPDHNPPNMMVYSPGVWEHICSGCGKKITFIVQGVRC